MEAYGFEPGMPFRADPPLFVHFPLEPMQFGAGGSKGRVPVQRPGTQHANSAVLSPAENGHKTHAFPSLVGQSEESADAKTCSDTGLHFGRKAFPVQAGFIAQIHALTIA
jgi:hypothetical protein